MNIIEEISREHSKNMAIKVSSFIGDNEDLFRQLMQLVLGTEKILSQRGAYVLSYCCDRNPELVSPYISELIKKIQTPDTHVAVKRCALRSFEKLQIPEKYAGELIDICFQYLESEKETLAVKVFAMTVIYNLSSKYPEIRNELRILIEDQLPYSSPGFQSRGKKILKGIQGNA